MRRVAFCLETLPVLTRAAELGQVSWGKLSEIVRKASPETEAAWLAIASKKNCREIEKLFVRLSTANYRGTRTSRLKLLSRE